MVVACQSLPGGGQLELGGGDGGQLELFVGGGGLPTTATPECTLSDVK